MTTVQKKEWESRIEEILSNRNASVSRQTSLLKMDLYMSEISNNFNVKKYSTPHRDRWRFKCWVVCVCRERRACWEMRKPWESTEIVGPGQLPTRPSAPCFLTTSQTPRHLSMPTLPAQLRPQLLPKWTKHFNLAFFLATLKVRLRTEGKNKVTWGMTKFMEGKCGINKDL